MLDPTGSFAKFTVEHKERDEIADRSAMELVQVAEYTKFRAPLDGKRAPVAISGARDGAMKTETKRRQWWGLFV